MSVEVEPVADPTDPSPRRARRSEQVRQARRRHAATMAAYGLAVALLAASIPVLAWIGARVILDSSDGEVVDPIVDPTEPGYQALVPPSPTLLVVQTDDAGNAVGSALLSRPSERGLGGGVMLIPPNVQTDLPGIGPFTIDAAFAFSGLESARATAERAIGVAIDDVVVLHPAEWAEIIDSVGPLSIVNPDTLRDTSGAVVFAPGPLELSGTDVASFAAFLSPDESRVNRLLRQEIVWRAWLDQLAADPVAVGFPGEQELGLARFLPSIVAGPHQFTTVPLDLTEEMTEPGSTVAFTIDDAAAAELIIELVPFPAGAPDSGRPLVRVLSGTGDTDAVLPAARRVVAGGGQVTVVGNADRFDHTATVVIYGDDARRDDAEAVVAALGFGTVTKVDEVDESADLVVVLGPDATL